MKSIKLIAVSILMISVICSCGDNAEVSNENAGNDINVDAVATAASKDPNAKGGNQCLLGYANNYHQLLTEEMALAVTGFPKERMDTKYSKVLKNNAYHSISYKFKMGRKQMVEQVGMMIELPEVISLKGIKPMSFKQFEDSYRSMTEEEEASFEEIKKDVLSGGSGNRDADRELKRAEDLGVGKQEIKKGTSILSEEFKKVGQAYVKVENLGDAARWNTYTQEIVVLQNGVQFEIAVNIAESASRNKAVAIDIAQQILNRCK